MTTHVNWQNGTWINKKPKGPQYEICIASDWAPIRAFSQTMLDDPEAVYGDLLFELRSSDLRIAKNIGHLRNQVCFRSQRIHPKDACDTALLFF